MSSSRSDVPGSCPRGHLCAEYVRGELAPGPRRRYEDHLVVCPRCREDAEDLQRVVDQLIAHVTPIESPPNLTARILSSLPRETARCDRKRRWLVVGLVSVAAILVGATALVWTFLWRGPLPDTFGPEGVAGFAGSIPGSALVGGDTLAAARGHLLSFQDADGSWNPRRGGGDPDYRVGLTGLVLLSLVGDDDTAARLAVERAGRYLAASQQAGGRLGPDVTGALFNHAIGTLALLELRIRKGAAGADDLDLATVTDRAVTYLCAQQGVGGGWGGRVVSLASPTRQRGDETTTLWALRALERAVACGLEIDRRVLELGFSWLESRSRGLADPRDPAARPGTIACFAADTAGTRRAARSVLDRLVVRLTTFPEEAPSLEEISWSLRNLRGLDLPAMSTLRRRLWLALARSRAGQGPAGGAREHRGMTSLAGGSMYTTALAALALDATRA